MGCCTHASLLVQQQDGSSGSGGRDAAEDLPVPEVPKQRRRRRKAEQQAKEFTIDDLNPISSAWAGYSCRVRPHALLPARSDASYGLLQTDLLRLYLFRSGPQVARGV